MNRNELLEKKIEKKFYKVLTKEEKNNEVKLLKIKVKENGDIHMKTTDNCKPDDILKRILGELNNAN